MSDKKIQMTQRNATNDGWDNLYPKTTGDQVFAADGTTFESHKADYTTFVNNYNARNADIQFLNVRGVRYNG